jgi:hypothetical protein
MANVLQFGGLSEIDLTSKLISFGANGVSNFQGAKTCVITQFLKKHAPFMLGVHYVAHCINLVV